MQRLLTYTLALLVVTPFFAAAQTIPAFPMAFWGNVTINGTAAPVGTVVRVYYGSTLAGEVTVQDAGVYGYTELTKQKLVVAEGAGELTFKVVASGFNGGAETGGTSAITHSGFIAGNTTQKDLAFTIAVPSPTPPPASGGGGGGGGGGGSIVPTPTPVTPVIATTTRATSTAPISASTIATPQGQVLGTTIFNFTRNLQTGSSGNDVTELQKILIAKGYLKVSAPTGFFGGLTAAAVKLYQKDNGLDQVGNVGPKTRAILNSSATPTLSDSAKAELIKTLMAQVQLLLAKIAELKSQQAAAGVQQ